MKVIFAQSRKWTAPERISEKNPLRMRAGAPGAVQNSRRHFLFPEQDLQHFDEYIVIESVDIAKLRRLFDDIGKCGIDMDH